MAKPTIRYNNGRVSAIKIGIPGYSGEKDVFGLVGHAGIGSTEFDAEYNLDVRGDFRATRIIDHVGNDGEPSFVLSKNADGLIWAPSPPTSVAVSVIGGVSSVTSLNVSGISTFSGDVDIDGHTELDDVNISGILTAATLNVTSVTGGIDVDGHTETDTLNVSGVSTFQDNVKLTTDNKKLIFGDNDDLEIFHNGVSNYIVSNTGSFNIKSPAFQFFTASSFSGRVRLFYGNSLKFETTGAGVTVFGTTETQQLNVSGASTFQGNVDLGDNDRLRLGDNDDLEIFHSANGTGIIQNAGSGQLQIRSNTIRLLNQVTDEDYAFFRDDGAVELYYDDTKKFETTGAGVTVFGTTETQQLNISGVSTFTGSISLPDSSGDAVGRASFGDSNDLEIYHNGTNSVIKDSGTGNLFFISNAYRFRNAADNEQIANFTENSSVELFYDNSKKFETSGYGVTVFGTTKTEHLNVTGVSTFQSHVEFGDNDELRLGNNQDLKIYHDGSNSYVEDTGVGALIMKGSTIRFRSTENEKIINAHQNGSVDLFHNNSKKFATTGAGVSISNGASTTATITAPANLIIDPAVVGDNTGIVRIKGDLFVDGTTTQINSTTLEIADFVVGIASTATTDLLADGAGIQIGPDNTLLYEHNGGTNPSLKSSENLNVASGKGYQVNQVEVLNATTLGSSVVNSSLTSVGTLGSLTVSGNVSIADKIIHTGDTNTAIRFPASDTLTVETAGSERLRITSDGFVGIGTNNPVEILDVLTPAGGRIQFDKAGSIGSRILFANADGTVRAKINNFGGSNETLQLDAPSKIDLAINGAEKVRLNDSGNLGIGNLSPSEKLDVGGTIKTEQLNVSGVSTFTGSISFPDSSGDAVGRASFGDSADLRIYHDGFNSIIQEVGAGDLRLAGNVVKLNNGNNTATMVKGTDGGSVELNYNGSKKFETTGAGVSVFGTTQTQQLNVSGLSTFSSNVTFSSDIDSDLIPASDDTYDLGAPNDKWRNLYIDGLASVDQLLCTTSADFSNNVEIGGDLKIADKIIHTGDTNTAIRFPAVDTFTVETAGSERFRITSAGKVGIGTANPSVMNHIYAASSLYTRFEQFDGKKVNFGMSNGDGIIDVTAANPLRVLVNGGERFRITSDGKFGFGTNNPQGTVHISSGTSGDATLILEADTDNSNDADNPYILFRQDGGINASAIGHGVDSGADGNVLTIANSISDGSITFATGTTNGYANATERLRIGSAGQIGLGGANYGSSGQVLTSNGSGSAPTWQTVSGISSVAEDTTPQLGGNLDVNGNDIVGTGNVNLSGVITATSFSGDGSNLTGIDALTHFSEQQNSSSPNNTVPVNSLSAIGTDTHIDVALVPKGDGSFSLNVPDGTSTGGNKRGAYAVDLQLSRSNASDVAAQDYSFLGGGVQNEIGTNGMACGIVAGDANKVVGSSYYSVVVGGYFNRITTSLNGIILSGSSNILDSDNSVVIGGYKGTTKGVHGIVVLPASNRPLGTGVTHGGVQSTILNLARETTDATSTVLSSNNTAASANNQLVLSNNSAVAFKGTCIAGVTGAGNTKAWEFRGAIKRGANAASTTLVGSVIKDVLAYDAGAAAWDVDFTADTTNGTLQVTVTGQASTTIRWVCKVEATEMSF